jgi:hypothetical protein
MTSKIDNTTGPRSQPRKQDNGRKVPDMTDRNLIIYTEKSGGPATEKK